MRLTLTLAALLGTATARADIKTATPDADTAWSQLDPFQQTVYIYSSFTEFMDATYLVDLMGDKLSPLARAAYVHVCLKANDPTVTAICQLDIAAFDEAKANAAIDADTEHKSEHASAKAMVAETKAMVAAAPAQIKGYLAKDDAYKQVFDLANKALKQTYGSTELRDVLLSVEDANRTQSRKAMAGCQDKVWPLWVKAVSAIPAKSFTNAYKDTYTEIEDAHAATILGTPDGYLAAIALVECFGEAKGFVPLREALNFWPGYRGPRDAAVLEIKKADLKLDKKGEKVEVPFVDRRKFFGHYEPGGAGGFYAPVKAAAVTGDKLHITFSEPKAKVTKCVDYKAGTRPSRIEADGRITYEGTCFKYADEMVSFSAPDPLDTDKHFAAGVKAGALIRVTDNAVLYVLPGMTAKNPSVVLGVPVK